MATYSFLTFIGGMLVGMGFAVLITVLAMLIWSKYGDTRR
jgi:mannose/fructose/N-acetylgalactosamine-specific phosphotransferase system component IIC